MQKFGLSRLQVDHVSDINAYDSIFKILVAHFLKNKCSFLENAKETKDSPRQPSVMIVCNNHLKPPEGGRPFDQRHSIHDPPMKLVSQMLEMTGARN